VAAAYGASKVERGTNGPHDALGKVPQKNHQSRRERHRRTWVGIPRKERKADVLVGFTCRFGLPNEADQGVRIEQGNASKAGVGFVTCPMRSSSPARGLTRDNRLQEKGTGPGPIIGDGHQGPHRVGATESSHLPLGPSPVKQTHRGGRLERNQPAQRGSCGNMDLLGNHARARARTSDST